MQTLLYLCDKIRDKRVWVLHKKAGNQYGYHNPSINLLLRYERRQRDSRQENATTISLSYNILFKLSLKIQDIEFIF